jgi:hypothetical protein
MKSPSSVLCTCLLDTYLLTLASPAALSTASATVTAATTIATAPAAISAVAPAARTSTTGFALIFFARLLGGPAFEHSLAREPDLTLRVDVGHHDRDLIAHVHNIFHFIDTFGIEL